MRDEGLTLFFTVVTYQRQPLFENETARRCLGEVFRITRNKYPFIQQAVCLLPDHIHCIWTLPENDDNYSLRWASIKANFTRLYKDKQDDISLNTSRKKRREKGFWQRRFWDHVIRNEEDLSRHVDYIHYNPVKHGLVNSPSEWKWSSFPNYVERGIYDPDWNPYLKEDSLEYGE
jgi:putative transposase